MISGKTRTGFEYQVNEKILRDWRIVKLMAKVRTGGDDGDIAFFELIEKFFGAEQEERLTAHCEDEDGIADLDKMRDELMDVFGHPEIKKLLSSQS